MARNKSNFPRRGSGSTPPKLEKSKINPNLGVYAFVDKDGNVTQIKKDKKDTEKYYPNEPSKVDTVLGDVWVIGVSDDIAMGVGDEVMAYAKYI